ncbi:MAG: hypothetical protein ACYTG7_16780 [Planctomycetota bacterium]|jgi:hypothetical protein
MKPLHIFNLIVVYFMLIGVGSADVPVLLPGVNIQDGGGDLEVEKYSTPTSVDWNNDGNKDLLVGQYVDGHIWLFINEGTDLNPVFNGGSLVESNGSPISTPYG